MIKGLIINKTMEKEDLSSPEVSEKARVLKKYALRLFLKGIPFAINGYLRLGYYVGWYKLWEYARFLAYSGVKKGMRILDIGGAATLPVFYLSEMGCEVTSVDIDKRLVEYQDRVSRKKKWGLTGSSVDICENELPDEWGRFDIIISFCVIEHMEKQGQLKALKSMAGALLPGGMMAITFDYGEGAKAAGSLRNLDEVKQLIHATGLSIEGNPEFIDKETRFMLGHKARANYTFGSLFFRK